MKKRRQREFSESIKAGESLAAWLPIIHLAVSSRQYDDVRVYFGLLIHHRRYETINMLCATLTENDVREVFLRKWGGVDEPGTLLHKLIAQRAPKIAKRILKALGDVYPGDYPDCWDVVDEAISVESVATVKQLFATSQVFCEARDAEGRTALHRTVALGDWVMTKTLFDMFPAFCAMQDNEGRTPLMDTVQIGRSGWVQYMLRYKGGFFYEPYLPEYAKSIAMEEILRQLTPKNQREEEQNHLVHNERFLQTGDFPHTSSIESWGSHFRTPSLGGTFSRTASTSSLVSQLPPEEELTRTSSIGSWGSSAPSGGELTRTSSIGSWGSSAPKEELTRTSSIGNGDNYGLGGKEFYYKIADPPSSSPQELKLNALGSLPVFGSPAVAQASVSSHVEPFMSRLRSISYQSGLHRIVQQISKDTTEISGNFITNVSGEITNHNLTDDIPSVSSSSLQRSNSTGGIDDRPNMRMKRRSSMLGNLVRRRNKSNSTKTETIEAVATAAVLNHANALGGNIQLAIINHDEELPPRNDGLIIPSWYGMEATHPRLITPEDVVTNGLLKQQETTNDDDRSDMIDEE